jgi:hypothetical protein
MAKTSTYRPASVMAYTIRHLSIRNRLNSASISGNPDVSNVMLLGGRGLFLNPSIARLTL